jgi:peptidyl-tRNA hydrolase, PTH1 family
MVSSDTLAFIGLGNPGPKYQLTRHNIGAMVVDHCAKTWNLTFRQHKDVALYATHHLQGITVLLVKPITFMNNSGQAAAWVQSYFKLSPEQVVVICDDIDIPLGSIRIRKQGSAGTHNGLKSIIQYIGTEFPRIRIGIFHEPLHGELADYVLSNFAPEEKEPVRHILKMFPEMLQHLLLQGIDKTMNVYNKRADD